MRLCSPGSHPWVCACVHPHPHTRVGAHPTCMCALPHTRTCHTPAQYTMGTRICCVHVTCTVRTCHIHHPCAHAATQPCTRVFSSPPGARLSLPCAASSPGLVSLCMEGGGLHEDQIFPTPAGGLQGSSGVRGAPEGPGLPHTRRQGGGLGGCAQSQVHCPVS